MKKNLLLALFVVLFFACSNEGLETKTERPSGNIYCLMQEQDKCYDVSEDICNAIGGEKVESCPLESSSSSGDGGSSSSDEGSSSSSSEGDSSSSGEGDSSSSGEGDSSSSGEGGSSSSGEGGSSSSGEGGSSSSGGGSSSSSDEGGSSSSEEVSSSSLAPPSLSECDLPSIYMHKGESITLADLFSIEGDSAGCGPITYILKIGSSSSSATGIISLSTHAGKTLTITANATCGTPLPSKTCKDVFVAERNVENIVQCGENVYTFDLYNGTTVFEYRCDQSKTDYYVACRSPSDAEFKLSAEGFTDRTSSWGGANLPGAPEPIEKEGFFYYPKRVLATVTSTPTGGGYYTCTSW